MRIVSCVTAGGCNVRALVAGVPAVKQPSVITTIVRHPPPADLRRGRSNMLSVAVQQQAIPGRFRRTDDAYRAVQRIWWKIVVDQPTELVNAAARSVIRARLQFVRRSCRMFLELGVWWQNDSSRRKAQRLASARPVFAGAPGRPRRRWMLFAGGKPRQGQLGSGPDEPG